MRFRRPAVSRTGIGKAITGHESLTAHVALSEDEVAGLPAETDDVRTAVGQLRGKPIRIFLFCVAIWSLSNMDQSLFSYAVPGILADLHIGLDVVAIMLSVGFVFTIIAVIIIGLLTDRFGRRLALALCLGFSGLFVGLQGLAETAFALTIFRALAFGVSGGLSPITNSFVAESAPPRIRGVMVGLLQCGYPIGWFIASIVEAPLMAHYGWRSIFIVGFVIVPLSVLIYFLVPESPRFEIVRKAKANREPWQDHLKELFSPLRRRRTLLSGLAFFAQGSAYAGSAFFLPTFFHVVRGYDEVEASRIVGLSYGIGIIGYIGASLVGEFVLTRRNTIILWCWTGVFAFLGFVWLPRSPIQDIFWCGLMAIFFYGATASLGTYLLELYPTRLRATGAAFGSAFLSLGFASSPIGVAHLVGLIGWQWSFTAVIAPALFVVGLAILGLDNFKSGQTVEDL
jgi:MFS family permease